jgi:myo-inositol-1(or 4)-monophosphatase
VPEALPPIYLATAIEAVLRAGDVQMQHFGGAMQVDKKGAIDLVTNIDVQVEREFRAMIAERFPDHAVLGEEFVEAGQQEAIPRVCWVFDPVDGTTNYAHGLPIFCSSLALEIDGDPVVGAVYDPTRRELFSAERPRRLAERRPSASFRRGLIDSLLVTGFPTPCSKSASCGALRRVPADLRAVRRLGRPPRSLLRAAGRFDAFWEQKLNGMRPGR